MTETTIRPILFKQDTAEAPIYLMAPWPEVTTIMPGMIDGKLVSRGVIAPNDVIFFRPDNGIAAYDILSESEDALTLKLRESSTYTPVDDASGDGSSGQTNSNDKPVDAPETNVAAAPAPAPAAEPEEPAAERAPDPEPTRTVDANGKIIV